MPKVRSALAAAGLKAAVRRAAGLLRSGAAEQAYAEVEVGLAMASPGFLPAPSNPGPSYRSRWPIWQTCPVS